MSDAFRFADTDNGKTWLWVALVSTASLVLSFSLACAVPLAAFAALAGLHMRKGAGLALVAAAWLVNQIVGYACLAYPLDASTIAWGFALLGSAAVAMGAARLARGLTGSYAPALLAGFVAAFVGYEGTIYLSHFALGGGVEAYAPSVIIEVLRINALAFVGLLAAWRIGAAIGFAPALEPTPEAA